MSDHDPKIIVALDFNDVELANQFINKVSPSLCRLKIGKQLFTQQGPKWVEHVINRGFDVFLDLKFHDIPNTVANACFEAAQLGVWMINVHAMGGKAMLHAAREGIARANSVSPPLLTGVTLLTSLSHNDLIELGLSGTIEEHVVRLAGLCFDAGLDGVVCSALEAPILKSLYGKAFKLVTPGIRPLQSHHQDQKRTLTPEEAILNGVDYLVIGRAITQSNDPLSELKTIQASLSLKGNKV